jgi:hypothetical protein
MSEDVFSTVATASAPLLTDDRTCLDILVRDVAVDWRRMAALARRSEQ